MKLEENRINKEFLLDIAYGILDIVNENEMVKNENNHLKELVSEYRGMVNQSIKDTNNQIGTILGAVLDKNSIINKGWQKIEEEKQTKPSA